MEQILTCIVECQQAGEKMDLLTQRPSKGETKDEQALENITRKYDFGLHGCFAGHLAGMWELPSMLLEADFFENIIYVT